MRKLSRYFFPILLGLLVISGCKKNKLVIDPGFSEHISAFTSGEISVASNIRIELTEEVQQQVSANTEVREELFDFSPGISGKAYWIDKRTIEFRPDKWLDPGKTYEGEFYLKKIKKVESKFKTFKFEFSTIKQSFAVSVDGYEPYEVEDLRRNKITGSIITADVVDEKKIVSVLSAVQDGKKLPITLIQSGDNNFSFQVDSVTRGEKQSSVTVSWNGDVIDVENKGEDKVVIPSIFDFLVIEAKPFQEPNQYIEIRFSDPLNKAQDFNGLITINKEGDLNYEVNKNILKVYFSSRITGSVHLKVDKGVKNSMSYPLKKAFETDIIFEDIKPAVRLIGKGTILPDSKGLILPFEAVNLKAVDVRIVKIFENNVPQFFQVNNYDGQYQLKRAGRLIILKTISLTGSGKLVDHGKWNTFSLDLTTLIKQEPGAIYRVEFSFKKAYSTYPCDEGTNEEPISEVTPEEFEHELSYWDAGDDYYDYEYDSYDGEGDYDWNERDNPCSASYYHSDRKVSCNIIASNLGITAKSYGNNKMAVAIADIVSTKPMNDVTVEVLNYQQQVIGSATTDGEGFCTIDLKGKPFLLVAKRDKQKGYLKLTDGNSLSYSQFDVSGNVVQKGVKGFVYGERGVWRPGDTVYLTCIIEDKQKSLPASHPVVLELFTPQGQLFKKIVKTSGIGGFYQYTFKTNDDSPTGNWLAKIRVGSVEFTKSLKIETIKPNRIKVNLDLGKTVLNTGSFVASLSAKWLHGAPAGGLKAEVTANLSKAATSFKGFESFTFEDPTRSFDVEEKSIFSGNLDNNGNAQVTGSLDLERNAPGMLRAAILTRVYETGGEFSIDNQVVNLSPYQTYVGLKIPKETYGYLETDTNQVFEVSTVSKDGRPLNKNNLEVFIYKLDRKWWWNATDDALANYESNSYATPVYHSKVSTVNGKGRFVYRLKYPDWGRFLVRVVDNEGGHAAGKVLFFDWPGWRGRGDREDSKNVSMLTFNADKASYSVGDKATVTFPSTKAGRILISLETGSNIIKQWWEDCSGKETKVSFDITEEMAPNVYVYASLIQPHASSGNDLPIRLYGVIPLKVENPLSHLNPQITAPEVVRPEHTFDVSVKEKDNKKMTYTLAIVDEGLLDITRFKTPDPWSEFYGREALGVRTWDLYDYIIGAYGGTVERLFAIGGDGDLRSKGDKKANRFKPIVKFLGPFELNGGANTHKITLPPYIGSVKVMVVAGNQGAFGNAEKLVAVRKPLMILASLPRVLSPGESLSLPVSVFAMDQKIKNVSLELQGNSFFTAEDGNKKNLSFHKPGEEDIAFRIKVNSKLGVGKVKVIAKSGSETDVYEIEIDVRNPNPKITQYFETIVDAGKTGSLSYTLPGMAGTNKATLEISSIPAIDLTRRLGNLIAYPHGCAEQTTSAAFPQLFLDKFVDMDELAKKRAKENINAAIVRLNTMQISDGGIAYWPGLQEANPWASSYVGHFMLVAKEKGYDLPSGFLKSWLKYQKKEARSWSMPAQGNEYYYQSDLIQAYRLYTLALADEADLGAMNRMKEIKGLSTQAIWRLAATYALAGQEEIAKQLMVKGSKEISPYSGFNYTYGSIERDWAMFLETYILVKDKTSAFAFMKRVAGALSSDNWLSTQSTAYSLYAIGKAIDDLHLGGPINCNISGAASSKVQTGLPVKQLPINSKLINGSVNIVNNGKGSLFVRVIAEGTPETGPSENSENNLHMKVRFTDLNDNSIDIDNLQQGKDFIMEVTVNNPGQLGDYKDMALTQIVPSGCEIINARFLEMASSDKESYYTYMDVRDDRVLTYFDLARGESKTFKVRMNASFGGKFYYPGVYCEAMYESKVNAFNAGKWIEIRQ
jgi:uncharacterized protein YfaS (alpha-2-macroglobulin family)